MFFGEEHVLDLLDLLDQQQQQQQQLEFQITDENLLVSSAALLQQNLLSLPGQSQTSLLQHQPGLALTPQVSPDHFLSASMHQHHVAECVTCCLKQL